MKLFVGLGNPGVSYVNTRHNTGFLVVDALKKVASGSHTKIFKSDKFMNESGQFVAKKITDYRLQPTDLYLIYDDLDIKLGEYKIQLGHSPKDHNGIKSVDDAIGTDQYWHVKVGIDNRPLDNRTMGLEYVLQNFSEEERTILDRVIKVMVNKITDGN